MRALTRSLCFCVAFGWSASSVAQAPNESGDFTIVIDPAVFANENSALGPAWLLYATAVVTAATSPEFRDRPVDDYAIEVSARTALARYWSEERPRRARTQDPYLDTLVKIHDAGFVEEYVLAVFAQPGWSLSAAELDSLDLTAFGDWARDHVDAFGSVTLAGVEAKSARPPVPTGSELPDPEGFEPSRCAASIESMRETMGAWEREKTALPGAPVAAEEIGHFLAILEAIRAKEPYRTQGVSWVSMRPALWGYYAGFCGVEVGDLVAARRWLEAALVMLPLTFDVRHELIHVLVMEGRLDEADTQIDDILDVATDDCALARAWRRRGYIRFEQRSWEEARTAYLRSLRYDPGNSLGWTS